MKYDLINAGDRVRLNLKRVKENEKKYFETEITEMYEGQKIFVIETPTGGFSTSETGDLYEFVVFTDDENVACDCVLVNTTRSEGKYYTVVRVVSPVVTAQLRAHPRYKMAVPVRYNVHEEGVDIMAEPVQTIKGIVQDISGGGMRFWGSLPVEEDTRIRIMVEKQEGSLIAEGVVVKHTELDEPKGRFKYEMRVKFITTGSSRRKKPRASCKMVLRYSILKKDDIAFSHEYLLNREVLTGEVRNISEGGIKFAGDIELEINTRLHLEIEGKEGILMTEGVVVSKLNPGVASSYRYENGVKFTSVLSKKKKSPAEDI